MHQEIDLILGPFPVLHAERIQRQKLHPVIHTVLGDGLDYLGALFMPAKTRQISLGGPASVAVHDDGDMTGDSPSLQAEASGGMFFFALEVAVHSAYR